jgi:pimeloyl-ACP methyl ester carboxylesterase
VERIDVAGGELEVLELRGDPRAAALVLLHEGLGSVGLWRAFPHDLAARTGRRVVAFSRHGHGGSATLDQRRGFHYMHHEAEVVLPAVLDRLGLDAPVLVGHSDGASIALLHAGGGAPVGGVVVLAPHVVVEDCTLAGIAATGETYRSGSLRQRLARHHVDVDTLFWGWHDAWLEPGFRHWDLTGSLTGIQSPVLMIQGRQDPYGTMGQLDAIAARITGPHRRLELEDCGHSPHRDRAEATLHAVQCFTRDLPS